MNAKLTLVIVLLGVIALGVSSSIYTIKENERGVLLRFGEVVDADLKAGLGFKIPVMNEIRRFDSRVLILDARPEEYLTKNKKRLIVDSYVVWRIENVKLFYTATGGFQSAAQRLLAPRVNEGLRNKFGERTKFELVSGKSRDELMNEVRIQVNEKTFSELGIGVLDIRVKRIELPPTVNESVYERMRAERQREARELRSQGKELAEAIRADADLQQRVIQAEAYEQAEIVRGEGDAISARIYAEAYGADTSFYEFYRTLSAYRETFKDKGDVIVMKPQGEFFKYLKSSSSKGGK
ncbi:MAG: protease modulator HflC [Pseudomonadales bacterium]|nr:protease modulator HflC [Pseudomonadales bacterium]